VNVSISPTYNGTVPASFNAAAHTCSNVSCHADAYSTGSVTTPPWGTASACGTCHGSLASGAPATGSHSSHMAASATCGSCHAGAVSGVSGGTSHLDGNIDVTDGYPVNVTKHPAGSGYSTCTSASCHASAYGAGVATTPTWGTLADCGSCHPVAANGAPATGSHAAHMTAGAVCADCHSGAVQDTNGGVQHTDGNIDVYKTTPGDLGYPQNVAKHAAGSGYSSCSTASCHGTATWGVVGAITCVTCHAALQTGTHGTPRDAVVGEFGLAWGHKKSGRGAVTNADCIVCHLEGNYASQARSAYHGDGNIDLRDPDGAGETPITNISGGAFTFTKFATSYAAGSRTSTGHTANTVDNVLTQKFCLACHDNNGATNTTSRTAGGTAFMPWGGVNLGANYTVANGAAAAGGVVDVKTQFAIANSSSHPVLGPNTRDFPYSTRLAAPYNNIGTARDSNGTTGHTTAQSVVLNCFDCHNVSGASPLTNRTVAAHGNAQTIRGTIYVASPTFCLTCHTGTYGGNTQHHGTGSAWATIGSNHGTSVMNNCHYCHGSNTTATAPARPLRAQDYHGNNALVGGGLWPTVNSRPYAFIRGWSGSAYQRPYRSSEFTTGSAQCGAGTCPGGGQVGDGTTRNYTPGGSY
jgi:predicted CxxxxCH...CXXCH cytochrome family protein